MFMPRNAIVHSKKSAAYFFAVFLFIFYDIFSNTFFVYTYMPNNRHKKPLSGKAEKSGRP